MINKENSSYENKSAPSLDCKDIGKLFEISSKDSKSTTIECK